MSDDSDQRELAARLDALLRSEAVWDDPHGGLEDAVVAAIADRRGALPRRRRRPVLLLVAAAASAAVLLGVTAVLVLDDRPSPPSGDRFELAATELAPTAEATAIVASTPAGTRIVLDTQGLRPAAADEVYHAWVLDGPRAVSAGTFHLRGGDAAIELWAGVAPDVFDELAVTREEVPPPGGGRTGGATGSGDGTGGMDGMDGSGMGIDEDEVVLRGDLR